MELHNYFVSLPSYRSVVAAYGGFQPMLRKTGDPPDPPPDLRPELWRPFNSSSQVMISLLEKLREGAALGGADALGISIAAALPPPQPGGEGGLEGGESDAASVSTLVHRPHRWFDVRAAGSDLTKLDVKEMAKQVRRTDNSVH